MNKLQEKQARLARRHRRVRGKISGTAERPRLCVTRSNSNMYVQVIDDVDAHDHLRRVDASAPTSRLPARAAPTSKALPPSARSWARRLMECGVTEVVFDRGGHLYHGRVKALADAAREAGLKF